MDKKVEVINKFGQTLAIFTSEDEETIDRMIDPVVTLTQNSDNVFSFSISEKSQKWEDIKSIENLYVVDGHVYSPLFEDSYTHIVTEDGQSLIQVRAYERQKMLEKTYVTAWNSETGFIEIDTFMVVILSKGNESLKNDGAIVDPTPYSLGSAGYIMKGLLYGTGWEVGIVDVEGYFDFETEQLSVYENLLKVQELYGGILIFDSMNKIVHLRDESKYLSYTGYEIRYRKNLKDMELDIDNRIVTKLYVFGEAGLNISSVYPYTLYIENYTYSNETYEGIETNTDIYEPEQLKRWGQRKLLELSAPRKTLTTNISYLSQNKEFEHEELDLNDSVKVYYSEPDNYEVEEKEVVGTNFEINDVNDEYKAYITPVGNCVREAVNLPDEYQQVDYIVADGTQYIRTGTFATEIEAKVKFDATEDATIFCSKGNLGIQNYVTSVINGQVEFDYDTFQYNTGADVLENTEYVIRSYIGDLYLNGKLIATENDYYHYQDDDDDKDSESMYNTILFANYSGGETQGLKSFFKGKIYYCKIWEFNNLIRDFVPCYRKSDNVIGLYDRIGKSFYANAGTSNFKKSEYELPPTYAEIKTATKNDLFVAGKNLFNKRGDFTSSTVEITSLDTGVRATLKSAGNYRYAHQTIGKKELLGKKIYLSGNIQASSTNKPHLALWYGNSTTSAVKAILALTANGTKSITLPDEFPDNCDRINLLIYANNNGTSAVEDYVDYTNLMVSITPIDNRQYEPYKTQKYSVWFANLPIELAGLGKYRDFVFLNFPTSSHYNKALNFDSWYACNNIKVATISNTTQWTKVGSSFQAKPFTPADINYSMSNFYTFNPVHVNASTSLNNYEFGYNQSGVLTIRDDRFKTAEEFQNYIKDAGLKIYYPTDVPTYTEITPFNANSYVIYLLLYWENVEIPSPYAWIYSQDDVLGAQLRYNVTEKNINTELKTEFLRVTSIDYPVFNPNSATLTLGDITANTNDIFKKISNTTNAYNAGLIPAGGVKSKTTGKPITQEFETQHALNSTFQYGIDSLNLSVSNISTLVDENGNEIKTLEEHIGEVEVTTEGLRTAVTNRSGNNLLRNSSALFGEEFWRGEVVQSTATEVQQNFFAKSCFYLQDGTLGQNIAVPNGDYYVGFKYKKLVELANCVVSVNGSPITLDKMEYTTVDKYITVNDNNIAIEIKSDTDNSCYIGDIMVVAGNKEKWNPNPNEIFYDTVEIGKGIQVNSNTANSYTRIDADGNRIYNKASREVVTELTDEGMITNKVYCEQLTAAGVLHQEVLDKYNEEQAWLTKI